MKNLYFGIQRFLSDEEGVTAIEYGLLAALIAIVIIAAVTGTGTNVQATFRAVCVALNQGQPGATAACG